MSKPRLRASLVIGCAAVTGAMSIGLWAFPSEVKAIIAEARLLADEGWIMSGTDNPVPDQDYLNSVESLYLSQDSAYSFQGLTTPEQFCPIVCNAGEPDLGFGDSVNQGVGDLNNVIVPALQGGNDVAVFGYSQSATVATVEMNDLLNNTPPGVNLNDLSVTLLGDPNSPIGGILDRFQFPDGVGAFSLSPEPQHVPFLDIPLSLATTPTTGIATDIYTGEYDGWANFPEDPSNLFADINALIGIETVHPFYPDPTPGVNLDTTNIIDLGTIGDTNFYDIPAPLPTLAFMYDGGPAGQFFYDFFAPSARLSDDWAYGNPGDPASPAIDPVDGPVVEPIERSGVARPWRDPAGYAVTLPTGRQPSVANSGVAGFIREDGSAADAGRHGVRRGADIRRPDRRSAAGCRQAPLSGTSVVDSTAFWRYDFNQSAGRRRCSPRGPTATASIPSLAPDAILDGAADLRAAADRPRRLRVRHLQLLRRLSRAPGPVGSSPVDVRVVNHPLAAARLTTLRDERTDNAAFRAALRDLTLMLVYEATRDAPSQTVTVRTPLAETAGTRLAKPPLLVAVLRAGLGMVDSALALLPEARVGFVGVARDEETASPVPYLESLPDDLHGQPVLVLDPMLATGGSMTHAIELLRRRGADDISVLSVVVAPEGIAALEKAAPNVRVFTAVVDDGLNDVSYIVPGLGDAGDRQFGPR